jgi:hypothetical protein
MESSLGFKRDGCKTQAKAVSVETKRRRQQHHIKATATTSLNDNAVMALTEQEQEKQAKTEEKEENCGTLDLLIDSITRVFQGKDQICIHIRCTCAHRHQDDLVGVSWIRIMWAKTLAMILRVQYHTSRGEDQV